MRPKDFNDAALSHPALGAVAEHAFDFALQEFEAADFTFDVGEVGLSDGIDLCTGPLRVVSERNQLADGVDLKAEFAGMADETQPPHVMAAVKPAVRVCPQRGGEQTHGLVVADGRHFDSGFQSQFADRYVPVRDHEKNLLIL